eukprot:365592-Chlamydomonas_euryale.AAC.5
MLCAAGAELSGHSQYLLRRCQRPCCLHLCDVWNVNLQRDVRNEHLYNVASSDEQPGSTVTNQGLPPACGRKLLCHAHPSTISKYASLSVATSCLSAVLTLLAARHFIHKAP